MKTQGTDTRDFRYELQALKSLGLPDEEIELIQLKREYEESWRE